MINRRNNKASGTSAPKCPAQSPPSGNVQGQGSSASTPGPTSQPSTDNSAKRTRVSSEPVMDQDNILTLSAPQDNTSTSSPSPPDSGTFLDDSQHSSSNSADKGKSVEILPPEPERAAKATTQESGDTKIIVVYFRSKPDMEKAIAAPIAFLHNLQFHEHDPSAKKANVA
ncbi:hypothetical protein RhiirA1_480554 [Rhizophagus irregularis]|uniref:Uncharacterized protein n=1 Tax=Rhizophagus irregularis TaxID=588596 RepID=A0A2N0QP77_9GLOM|nr:hypothetical protein RhiirA1_480554 [Rhizophagus irregularis]